MFNYGQGFSYSCAGHTLGSGYGGTQNYNVITPQKSPWTLVLVLFVVLVLFGQVICW